MGILLERKKHNLKETTSVGEYPVKNVIKKTGMKKMKIFRSL